MARAEERSAERSPRPSSERSRARSRARRTARFCLITLGRITALALVAVGAFVARLAYGPIQLDALAPEVESRLNASLPGWRVDVGGLMLAWRRERGDVGFTLRDVALTDATGAPAAAAREAIVELDLSNLLVGVAAPTELSLSGGEAVLLRTEEGMFRFALSAPTDPDAAPSADAPENEPLDFTQTGESDGFSAVAAIVEGMSGDRGALENLAQFERLVIDGFTVRYVDNLSDVRWMAPNANLTVERSADGLAARFSSLVEVSGDHPPMALALSGTRMRGADAVDVTATFANATGEAIASQVPDLVAFRALDAYASGSAEARVALEDGDLLALSANISTQDARIRLGPQQDLELRSFDLDLAFDPIEGLLDVAGLDFSLGGVTGSATGAAQLRQQDGQTVAADGALALDRLVIDREGVFEEPLRLSDISLDFDIDATRVQVKRFSFASPDAVFAGYASVELEGDDPETRLIATFSDFPATRLPAHWPLFAASNARDWYLANILDGQIEGGTLAYITSPSDEDFRVTFNFSDLTGVAVQGMTPITEGAGEGSVNLDRFDLRVDAGVVDLGEAGALDLAGSTFAIPSFAVDIEVGEVDLLAAGPLRAALTLIDQPPLGLLSRLGKSPDDGSGDAEIRAKLSLPLLKALKTGQVSASVEATLRDMAINATEIGGSVTAREAALEVDTRRLTLSGSMALNGAPIWLRWTEVFSPGAGDARSVFDVRTRPTAEQLWEYGAPRTRVLSGRGDLRGRFQVFDRGPVRFDGAAKLDGLALALPAMGWSKTEGEPGEIEISAQIGEDGVAIEFPQVSAGDLFLKGRLDLSPEGAFRRFEAAPFVIGDGTEVTLAASPRGDDGLLAAVRGRKLDLRPAFDGVSLDPGGADDAGPEPSVELDLKVDRVRLSDETYLHDAVALATSGPGRGVDVSADGRVGGRVVVSASYNETPGRPARFQLASADAGELLRALGVFEDGYGGALDLSGTIPANGPTTGELRIDDIVVRDAPELAQILSFATFIGLLDALGSGGITFVKVAAPFTLTDELLKISEAAATGPSMGITLDGTVNRDSGALRLAGEVSPAYGVSSLVKVIPILGQIVTGGEGEGIVGASYRVRGTTEDPQVSVNPLSVLAVGPFRRLFSANTSDAEPRPRSQIPPSEREDE